MRESDRSDADRLLGQLDLGLLLAEKQEKHQQEMQQILLDFLELVDGLEELERHSRKRAEKDLQSLPVDSIVLLIKRAFRALTRYGIEPLQDVGRALDLERDEVIAVRPGPPGSEDVIVDRVVRGYLWNGRVLRRARVVVSAGPGAEAERESE